MSAKSPAELGDALSIRLRLSDNTTPKPAAATRSTEIELKEQTVDGPSAAVPHQDCKMFRTSEATMKKFRASAENGSLVLFTPVMMASKMSPTAGKKRPNVDPFETLGRALDRYSQHTSHLPYVSKAGFTAMHEDYLRQVDAGAVVIVLCEPDAGKRDALQYQAKFADEVYQAVCPEAGDDKKTNPALVLVRCGDTKADWWPDTPLFDTVLDCRSRDPQGYAKHLSHTLFRGPLCQEVCE